MRYLILLSALFILGACSPRQGTLIDDNKIGEGDVREVNGADGRTLDDYLRTVSGVTVSGSGPNATINIRGIKSLQLTQEPLFVVDGVPAGLGLASVYNIVDVPNIKRIAVLKNPSDLATYGSRGANGVIKITTIK